MDKFNVEKDVAACIKKEFDDKHNPTWHCVVGKNFGEKVIMLLVHNLPHMMQLNAQYFVYLCTPGSYVTHETSHFIYFYLGPVAVLLFKSG